MLDQLDPVELHVDIGSLAADEPGAQEFLELGDPILSNTDDDVVIERALVSSPAVTGGRLAEIRHEVIV